MIAASAPERLRSARPRRFRGFSPHSGTRRGAGRSRRLHAVRRTAFDIGGRRGATALPPAISRSLSDRPTATLPCNPMSIGWGRRSSRRRVSRVAIASWFWIRRSPTPTPCNPMYSSPADCLHSSRTKPSWPPPSATSSATCPAARGAACAGPPGVLDAAVQAAATSGSVNVGRSVAQDGLLALRRYSREQELEADRLALGYIVKAGYPGAAMAALIDRCGASRAGGADHG